jgi:hypothetical protein
VATATKVFGGNIEKRELAFARISYDMPDASVPELIRVCVLMRIPGMTIDEAKKRVTQRRNPPELTLSTEIVHLAVRLPVDELEAVKDAVSDLTDSQLLRYVVARSGTNHDAALELATAPKHGGSRPGAGRPRKQNAA